MIEIKYSEIEFIYATILIVIISIQILFYLFLYLRVRIAKQLPSQKIDEKPVSVIICAKNEEQNLRRFLPLVLDQNYSKYEVIVVNDCSIDDTETYVTNLQKKHSNLKYSFIKEDPKFKHSKKLAVTIGIKAAEYDYFMFIDADCYPETKQWLSRMYQQFQPKIEIVLGYGGYEPREGFLDKLIRYDTVSIATNYLSFAHAGIPYMGVGRNMAYSREAYMKSSRFTKHYHIQSGDDDLFVAEVGRKGNTAIELSEEGYTRSEPVETFSDWCSQKRRHLTTSYKYREIHKFLLGLEQLSRILFYTVVPLYFILGFTKFALALLILIGLRLLSLFIINNLNMNRLHEKKLLLYSPLFDILLPFLIGTLYMQNKLNIRKRKWK